MDSVLQTLTALLTGVYTAAEIKRSEQEVGIYRITI